MEQNGTRTDADSTALFAGEAWFDPIEAGVRDQVRGFIQELLEQELAAALGRARHERAAGEPVSYRNGTRERQLLGSFGPVELSVPRARMTAKGGGTQECPDDKQVEVLIAGAYLAGTNTRRVKRALAALFGGAVGKDVVSRTWRKVRTDWDAWNTRDLAGEDVVRLILDGTVVLVAIGVDPVCARHGCLVPLGWDRGPCAQAPDVLAERVATVATVGDDPAGYVWQLVEQRHSMRQLVRLPWGQDERHGPADCVGDHASLGSIATTRAAKCFTMVSLY